MSAVYKGVSGFSIWKLVTFAQILGLTCLFVIFIVPIFSVGKIIDWWAILGNVQAGCMGKVIY